MLTYLQFVLYAQGSSFTVLAVSGKVFLISGNSNSNVNLTIGAKLVEGDKLQLNEGSYIGLFHSNGKTIEIKNPGQYDYSQVLKALLSNSRTTEKKFSQFVYTELTNKLKKAYEMKMTGAVVRGRLNFISVNIPYSFSALDSTVNFSWNSIPLSKGYIFKLINNSGQTVFMKKMRDTSINVNLNSLYLESDINYKWVVFNYENEKISSDTNYFSTLSTFKIKEITDSLNEIYGTIGSDNNALNAILYAEFYQRNNLNIEALNEYKRAVDLEPSVELYNNLYQAYLIKMKLE